MSAMLNAQTLQQQSINAYGDFIVTIDDDVCMIMPLADDILSFPIPSPYEM